MYVVRTGHLLLDNQFMSFSLDKTSLVVCRSLYSVKNAWDPIFKLHYLVS